jgi:hypothetical protein
VQSWRELGNERFEYEDEKTFENWTMGEARRQNLESKMRNRACNLLADSYDSGRPYSRFWLDLPESDVQAYLQFPAQQLEELLRADSVRAAPYSTQIVPT